jgi:hypothetical protein
MFVALGNDRPGILIRLEDHVLQAIIDISEGKSRDESIGALYSLILPLEKDLENDDNALNWFNLSKTATSIPSTPTPSDFPSMPHLQG